MGHWVQVQTLVFQTKDIPCTNSGVSNPPFLKTALIPVDVSSNFKARVMTRNIILLVLLLYINSLTACQQRKEANEENKNRITISRSGITNEARFVLFINNLNNNIKDHIEIYSYTVEGDSIIKIVEFNGKSVIIINDHTRDEYASTIDQQISKREFAVDSIKKINKLIDFIYKY